MKSYRCWVSQGGELQEFAIQMEKARACLAQEHTRAQLRFWAAVDIGAGAGGTHDVTLLLSYRLG